MNAFGSDDSALPATDDSVPQNLDDSSAVPDSPGPPPAPVTEAERVRSLDILRGVAVLGILYMNIQSFAMPDPAYGIPVAWGDLTGLNYAVWLAGRLFVDQKFMTIFSMLFGAGIVLMADRLERRGRNATGVHYRRMLVLLIFGLLHSYGLWSGDVLYHYAACGMIVYPLRTMRPASLIAFGLTMLVMGAFILATTGLGLQLVFPKSAERMNWDGAEMTAETAAQWDAYRGSYLEQMPQRVAESVDMHVWGFVMFMMWRVIGCMLLGMGLFKLGVFNAALSGRRYALIAVLGGATALIVEGVGVWESFRRDWAYVFVEFHGSMYNYWASLAGALAWIGIVMLYCRRLDATAFAPMANGLAAALHATVGARLAAVGRMAFTNYIMQTVICTTIFYGHGLGLFGDISRTGQLGITGAVWLAQLLYSPLWLHYFRMGPLEWLWRTLTYMRLQSLRRRQPEPAPFSAA